MVTRVERPRSRLCVFILAMLFLGVFFILLGIGDQAPDVLLVSKSQDDANERTVTYRRNQGVNFYHASFSMTPENQLFWLDLRLSSGDGVLEDVAPLIIDVEVDLEVHTVDDGDEGDDDADLQEVVTQKITTTQYCRAGEEWCDYFFAWRRDFIDHDHYILKITFPDPVEYLPAGGSDSSSHTDALMDVETRVTSINPEFTRFEISWKYLWLVTTLLVMFCPCGVGFLSALKRRRKDTGQGRTHHQAWTVRLLWALVFFDDPFVAATVYSGSLASKVFSAVFILSASMFVFLILLFWLCFLSDLRRAPQGVQQAGAARARRGICYWVPKVLLTGGIGVTLLGGYMYYRFENTLSFDYTGVDDEKEAAEALAGLLGFMLAVYMLWVILLALRSCGSLRQSSPSFILLFFITLLTCLVAVIGVFVAAYYPYSTSAVAFVGIHGLLNLYIWTLAASFSPVRAVAPPGGLGMGDKPVALRASSSAVTGTDRGRAAGGGGAGGGAGGGGGGDNSKAWEDPGDSDFRAVEL